MNKKLILPLCLITSSPVLAEEFYGLGGMQLRFKDSPLEVNASTALMGYKFGERNFTLSPLVKYISGRTVKNVEDKALEHGILLSVKAQYTFNNGIFFSTSPSIGSFNYANKWQFKDDEREFELGVNLSFGYEFSKYFSTELTYDEFKSANAIGANINFSF